MESNSALCASSHERQPIPWPHARSGTLLARRTEEGMEADDFLCSRNARPQKTLVVHAQWKINLVRPQGEKENRKAVVAGSGQ
jgi:hypothetical protein